MGAHTGYIYIRGEFYNEASNIQVAIDEAYAPADRQERLWCWLRFDLYLHRGAGA